MATLRRRQRQEMLKPWDSASRSQFKISCIRSYLSCGNRHLKNCWYQHCRASCELMSQLLIQNMCSVWQICGYCCTFQISVLFLTSGVSINGLMTDWRETSMVWSGLIGSYLVNGIHIYKQHPWHVNFPVLLIYPKRTHYTVDLEELKGIYRVTLIFMSLYTGGHFAAPLHCTHYTIIFCFRNVAIWINSYRTIYCTSDGGP